jgi:sulfur-carrier protein
MRVLIPTPLRSYTSRRSSVEAEGQTLGALVQALDERYPGIRFRMIDEQDRIRTHIQFFVEGELARSLDTPLHPTDEIQIVCALSGG